MKGGPLFLRIRVVESEDLRLAAQTSAHAHIAGVVAPSEYFICDTVQLLQADGAAAAISILTDFTRTNVYLWPASIEGVPAGISTPRTMMQEDEHFPLHPLNEQETLFQVTGLSLETLVSWDGHDICLETDKLEETMYRKELADLRGEDVMQVEEYTPPWLIEQFEDFNDPPLWGQDPKTLEKTYRVTIEVSGPIEVLNNPGNNPPEWLKAYVVRVSGYSTGVRAFRNESLSHPPTCLSPTS